ncbi:MAG: ATP-binding cassette domain-containing protein [Rhodospirillales bacterium]|nr:ATP-binding cassette domain-containing protein [Rhodospirillales bacterium]
MSGAPAILPLAVEGLTYTAGEARLIDDLTFRLEPGPRTVIVGPNGAGKSLLLRLCHGLLTPTAGTIRWSGGAGPDASRRQAMVFQRPVMLRRSAAANVEFALSLRHIPRDQRKQRVAAALAKTGLADVAGRPARVLSFGEQQRLALARAWALEPQVLWLDEPTASLDPAATRAVEAIIDAIHAGGTKIVMTTHDLGQARRLGDEIVLLHKGRIVERAPTADFFERPQSPLSRAFIQGELLW